MADLTLRPGFSLLFAIFIGLLLTKNVFCEYPIHVFGTDPHVPTIHLGSNGEIR